MQKVARAYCYKFPNKVTPEWNTKPVSWNKLEEIRPTDFTPKTVLESTIGKRDEWEGVLKNKQDFGKILSTVKEMII